MSSKTIAFECYEIIDNQPVYSVEDLTKSILRSKLLQCKNQQEVYDIITNYSRGEVSWVQEVAEEINSPFKEFIDKIVLLS